MIVFFLVRFDNSVNAAYPNPNPATAAKPIFVFSDICSSRSCILPFNDSCFEYELLTPLRSVL